jgi:hypothetical protein
MGRQPGRYEALLSIGAVFPECRTPGILEGAVLRRPDQGGKEALSDNCICKTYLLGMALVDQREQLPNSSTVGCKSC